MLTSRPRRSALPWLALAAIVVGAWWTMRTPPVPRETRDDPPIVAPPPAPPIEAPVVVAPQPTPAPHVAAPVAPTPSRPSGSRDPCGDGEADRPVDRPSIDDLLQARVSELNDRVRITRSGDHASTALREGLAEALSTHGSAHALDVLARAPDRIQDGFDTYAAVLDVLAARALGANDVSTAVRLATIATRAAPDDALSRVVLAIALERRGDDVAATDTFREAFRLEPDEPAIAYAVAGRLRDDADVATAVAALDRYLAEVPEDDAAARSRARLSLRAAAIPGLRVTTRDGVSVVAASTLDRAIVERTLSTVSGALGEGARLLGVPRRARLAVFVYPDRDAMRVATCAQGWTGAMFDGALHTDAETLADARRSTPTLRHESFHAAVHPAVPRVPTWLDEGLAQYLAHEEGPAQFRSYALMVRERTWVPFGTMNDAFLVIDDAGDAGLAYHQSLAMVLWLVDRRGERGVADAMAWLASGGDPARVLEEAARAPLDGDTLLAFLARRAPR